jgi:hypothetical protein
MILSWHEDQQAAQVTGPPAFFGDKLISVHHALASAVSISASRTRIPVRRWDNLSSLSECSRLRVSSDSPDKWLAL